MKKNFVIILVLLIVAAGLIYYFDFQPKESSNDVIDSFQECVEAGNPVMESYPRQCRAGDKTFIEDIGNELEKMDLIRVDSPRPNSTVQSPLKITGQAKGYWFFEADFPVKLFDAEGNLLKIATARAQSDWMTEDFVPFEAELSFEITEDQKGVLVLEKDNPSGLPENADELHMPLFLQANARNINLYYYNYEKDKDKSGNVACSRNGLVAVQRDIPLTQTPIQDAVRLLLEGELTEEERIQGIDTEYPLPEFSLKGASLKDGVLTLEFSDPQNKTTGGSCRVGILWFQVEATAKQFSGVEQVRFMPEDLFQP